MQADISGLGVDGVVSAETHSPQVEAAICEHLFRQGRMDIGEMIMQVWASYPYYTQFTSSPKESGISVDPAYIEQFTDLNQVLDALRNKDLEPALSYVHPAC